MAGNVMTVMAVVTLMDRNVMTVVAVVTLMAGNVMTVVAVVTDGWQRDDCYGSCD